MGDPESETAPTKIPTASQAAQGIPVVGPIVFFMFYGRGKKVKRWGFGIVLLTILVLGGWRFVRSDDKEQEQPKIIIKTGNNSPVNQAGHDLTINNGLSKEQMEDAVSGALQRAMRQQQEEKGPELSRIFPLGYAIFAISQTKEVVPMRFENGDIAVDWKNSYSEMTRKEIKLHLGNVRFPHVSMSGVTISILRESNVFQGVYHGQYGELLVALVKTSEDADVLVLGARGPNETVALPFVYRGGAVEAEGLRSD